jgi:hypothetical protein
MRTNESRHGRFDVCVIEDDGECDEEKKEAGEDKEDKEIEGLSRDVTDEIEEDRD